MVRAAHEGPTHREDKSAMDGAPGFEAVQAVEAAKLEFACQRIVVGG
ncbi:hypothetical protein [Granulicella aggregans]|nr:hypothetical protein [Granulicella aggregans]